MAYNQHLADRMAQELKKQGVRAEAKRLMGGLCFVLGDKMCVGTSIEKVTGKPRLIARIGAEEVKVALKNSNCQPFAPTGRIMKDFISISDEDIDLDENLSGWIKLSIQFCQKTLDKKT